MEYRHTVRQSSIVEKGALLLSIFVMAFWVMSRWVQIYKVAVVGAIFEILWFPVVLLTISLPLFSGYQLFKKQLKQRPYFLFTFVCSVLTLLFIWLA